MEMRSIAIALLFIKVISTNAQSYNNFSTPWWGALGFHANSTWYSGNSVTIKAPLIYVDCRAVLLRQKDFIEFGFPVASYFLTGVAFRGGVPDDNGEVSYLYGKLGRDIIKTDLAKIGFGVSIDARGINVDGIEGYGASLESYGIISPMIYAKINIGSFLLVPVFEYNLLSWTNTSGSRRPGFSLGSHVVIPLGEKIGINLNPAFEKGNFKSDQGSMNSSNISFKVGLMVRVD
jgi:hypothetical protein